MAAKVERDWNVKDLFKFDDTIDLLENCKKYLEEKKKVEHYQFLPSERKLEKHVNAEMISFYYGKCLVHLTEDGSPCPSQLRFTEVPHERVLQY